MKITITLVASLFLIIATAQAQAYPELIKVTGGTFTMGDEYGVGEEDELPTHQVTLSDFYISKTEVTVAQYRTYCDDTGYSMPEEPYLGWNSNDPIVMVSWNDAINYCEWLSEKLDKNISLPTEAQWEFSARGGSQSQGFKYAGDSSMANVGWYFGNSNTSDKAPTVATKKANELGLYDMSGNVWEWCRDWYDEDYYASSPSNSPKGPNGGSSRVLRGGSRSWSEASCRVAARGFNIRSYRDYDLGFRVALSQ